MTPCVTWTMCVPLAENLGFFWLWNMMQQKIQQHVLYSDILAPEVTFGHMQDAPHSNGVKRKAIFKTDSANQLAPAALRAFGMEQACAHACLRNRAAILVLCRLTNYMPDWFCYDLISQ